MRLTVAFLAALTLGTLVVAPEAIQPRVGLDLTPAATAPWLDRLNSWRATSGVPTLTENTTWSQGDAAHSQYMVRNDLVTHDETVGTPYYTVAGAAAAKNGNITVSSTTGTSDATAIDWWMGAPFHALGLMDPRLKTTGFGSYRLVKNGWQMGATVDVLRGNTFTGGKYPVYFPGDGSIEPLTTYSGGEFPDPLAACAGYTQSSGLPVSLQVGGNVATKLSRVHSFTGNGVALEHCILDSTTPNLGSNLTSRGAIILIPKLQLKAGVKYVVSVVVNNIPYTWSFNVGAFNVFNPLACTSVTATATPGPPSKTGTLVTIGAAAIGCPNPLYRISIRPPGGAMSVVQDYLANASLVWNAPQTPGAYTIEVDARDATSTIPHDTLTTLSYSLIGCTSANLIPDLASPRGPGATVTFTATSTGCNATPLYEFWLQAPGSTAWIAKTGFGASTWAWNTTGLKAGVYGIGVYVRATGSTAVHEAYWLGTYTLSVNANTCAAAKPATLATSPQAPGAPIIWTGTALPCSNPEYRFYLLAPGGVWTMTKDWSTSGWTWQTAGLPSGTYQVGVWARQIGSTNIKDAYGFDTFVLGAGNCISTTMSPNPAPPQASGPSVFFTANSKSCTSPQYEFWLMAPGGGWVVKRSFLATATWTWNTAGYAAGTYQVGVWVKQAGSTKSHDAYYIGTYQLTLATCTAATIVGTPTSPKVAGTQVTFTATAAGCSAPRYEFWELVPPSTAWNIVKPYGTGNTYTWDTTGKSGAYRFGVWAKQNGSTASHDTYGQTTFWVGS